MTSKNANVARQGESARVIGALTRVSLIRRIDLAAAAIGESRSQFLQTAAAERAEKVLAENGIAA